MKKTGQRPRLFAILFCIGIAVVVMGHNGTVAATAPCPPAPGQVFCPEPGVGTEPAIPTANYNVLKDCVQGIGYPGNACTHSPVYAQWISDQGSPSTLIKTVPYGTTSINLDFNDAIALSTSRGVNLESQTYITDSKDIPGGGGTQVTSGNATIAPGFIHQKIDANFQCIPLLCSSYIDLVNNTEDKGFYYRPSRVLTLQIPGGITADTTFDVLVTSRTINHFNVGNSNYQCVTNGTYTQHVTDMNDFGPCPDDFNPLSIRINVANSPPTGTLTANCSAGGELNATFRDPDGPTQAQIVRLTDGKIIATSPVDGSPWNHIPISSDVAFSSQQYKIQVKDVPSDVFKDVGIPGMAGTGPCGSVSCGSLTTFPATVEAGVPFGLNASFSYPGGAPPPPDPGNESVKILGPGFNQTWTPGTGLQYTSSAGVITLKIPLPPGVTIPNTGAYLVDWSIHLTGATTNCDNAASRLIVYNKPYFEVTGGDVSAGGGIPDYDQASNTATCTPPPPQTVVDATALIASWNNRTGGTPPYSGAGTQYAARALGKIVDFVSAQDSSTASGFSVSTPVAVALSFSNTVGYDDTNGTYGGNFGAGSEPPCDANSVAFIADTLKGTDITASAPWASGNYTYSGNKVLYVKGDITITHNIYEDSTPRTDISQIPHLRVVALGGNIYIDPGVTNLDGLFYAVPDTAGNGGQIYTCSNGSTPWSDTQLSAQCGTHLTINGALMAKRVLLLRTSGSVHNAPGAAAETINYSPEMWITTGGTTTNDAYTSLPPVL